MPNTKNRPFPEPNTQCYNCPNLVLTGSYNWTYDTQRSRMFRHVDCNQPHMMTHSERLQWEDARGNNKPVSIVVTPPIQPIVSNPVVIPEPTANGHMLDAGWNMEFIHCQFEQVLDAFKLQQYPFLWGPPGSGKTTLFEKWAEQCSFRDESGSLQQLDFLPIACSNEMSRAQIFGSKNVTDGKFNITRFRKIWENGGIILLDEACLMYGSFSNQFNSALAQKLIAFDDGISVRKSERCYIAFADNTNGHGKDDRYPSRNDLEAALRNRLCYIKFEYDDKLRKAVSRKRFGLPTNRYSNPKPTQPTRHYSEAAYEHVWSAWNKLVDVMKPICERHSLAVTSSPRMCYAGSDMFKYLMDNGREMNEKTVLTVLDRYLWEGLEADTIGVALSEIQSKPEFRDVYNV